MAQKKDFLAKVFGTRLSNRLRGSKTQQQQQQPGQRIYPDPDEHPPRPSTAPSRDAPRKSSYKRNPPPPIRTNIDPEELEALAIRSESDQGANSEGGRPRSSRRRRRQQQQQRNDGSQERPRTAPNGSSRRITIASPPPMPDLSPRRLPRRTSLKQRFWSANPSNQFLDVDDVPGSAATASRTRSVYMPRHAATDFSKTALARRTSVHARAAERIARRFSSSEENDDDAKTLCSINCREEQDPEEITRDLDLWLATLRRQQAAMQTAPANGSSSSSADGDNTTEQQQQHHLQPQPSKLLQCPTVPRSPLSPHGTFTTCTTGTSPGSNFSHAAVTESEGSDDEYGVFSQLQAETRNKAKRKSKAQALAAVRCSAIITTPGPLDVEVDESAPNSMADDPILHRASTYGKLPLQLPPSPSPSASRRSPKLGVRPKSLTASRSPRFSTFTGGARPPVPVVTPGANTGPIMTDYLEPSLPRSSMVRTKSENRRTSCAKSPAVTTVVEAS